MLQDIKQTSGLRPISEEDVTPVADLIWKVLHQRATPSPQSLQTHLKDLFLLNPWREAGIVSRVYEDSKGKIVGFFGAVPRRMKNQGKTIKLAFGSNFVVDPESRATMLAIQLVRSFMKGSQDISITDSANEMSRPLLRSLGFSIVPVYSLHWARPLRACRYAVEMLSRAAKSRAVTALGTAVRPFCSVADAMSARLRISPIRQISLPDDEDLDNATLLQCINTIPARNWLLPDYDQNSLDWVLDFITSRHVFGDLRKAKVRDKDGKIVGWYIYAMGKRGIGEVFQIGAETPSISRVLDHLFHDAWKRGLLGLHGRMEPQFMQELTSRSCFFYRHGSWTLAHSSQPDLLSMLHSGTAFFSRLDGEWALRHGGNLL